MSAGYIYVLAFDNGTVKVGRTQNTVQRMYAHKSDARKFGLTITDEWLSPLHAEWDSNELQLKYFAAGLADVPMGREYFSNISFASVVSRATELAFTPPPASEADEGITTIPAHTTLRAIRVARGLTSPMLAAKIAEQGIKVDPDHLLSVELGHKRASNSLLVAWASVLQINHRDIHMAAELREIVAAADAGDDEAEAA
jgi:hypothetical protein